MSENRLPTGLWIEAHLCQLQQKAVPYYITQKGEPNTGVILLKINALENGCRLLIQQRDLMSGELGWMNALEHEEVEETAADAYIARAIERDPDLWVIEIEDTSQQNPFEGQIL